MQLMLSIEGRGNDGSLTANTFDDEVEMLHRHRFGFRRSNPVLGSVARS